MASFKCVRKNNRPIQWVKQAMKIRILVMNNEYTSIVLMYGVVTYLMS